VQRSPVTFFHVPGACVYSTPTHADSTWKTLFKSNRGETDWPWGFKITATKTTGCYASSNEMDFTWADLANRPATKAHGEYSHKHIQNVLSVFYTFYKTKAVDSKGQSVALSLLFTLQSTGL
jgi:hypothetical protein